MKYLIILIGMAVASCAEPEKPPFELPADAMSLLTGDSSKSWKLARRFNNKTRMNMGDCFLEHRDTYKADFTMHNNSGAQSDCGETLNASWKFTKDKKGNSYIRWTSDQLPQLLNIDKNYKSFKILELSEEQMTLQFSHKQFSDKTTIITDIWVPEDASIEDREFHW
ncbi:MAG: lipocalin family protein [Cyclobacteriaceae bacterium]